MCEHVFALIVCVLLPRFELAVAAGGRETLAAGPVALAPEPGREQLIGEASAAAEAYGVRAGLRLGEALARCPTLRLVPPDPAGVADEWERAARPRWRGSARRSSRGAPASPGSTRSGLRTLHGGSLEGVLAAARRALGDAGAARAPRRSRFAALAAARAPPARAGPEIAPSGAAALRRLPRAAAGRAAGRAAGDGRAARGARALRRSARSASWPRCRARRWPTASARPGLLARDLARGRDTPLRPRAPVERLEEALELPESASGAQLERALGLLIDRLLARRERRGRTLRAVVLSAALVEGGTWRARVTFREALADPRRMRLVLAPRLAELPAPAEALRLRVEGFGPPAGDQRSLLAEPAAVRARGCARRSARRARSPGRRPRCGSSPSTRTRACPSAASRWRRGSREPAEAARQAAARRAVRDGRRQGRPEARRRPRGRGGARVLAGRGPLVDADARAPPLLGGRHRLRAQPRRLPRPRRRGVVRAALARPQPVEQPRHGLVDERLDRPVAEQAAVGHRGQPVERRPGHQAELLAVARDDLAGGLALGDERERAGEGAVGRLAQRVGAGAVLARVHQIQQRAVLGREAHVGARERAEPVGERGSGVLERGGQLAPEALEAVLARARRAAPACRRSAAAARRG